MKNKRLEEDLEEIDEELTKKEKKPTKKSNRTWAIILFLGILAILIFPLMFDVGTKENTLVKVYEAECSGDFCDKGERVKSNQTIDDYTQFTNTCSCQVCYQREVSNPHIFESISDCSSFKQFGLYCQEFLCGNKQFIVEMPR